MKSFKIVFFRSDHGELVKVKTLFRLANSVSELVANPPQEFMDMLVDYFPIHGWVEMEDDRATAYVVFVERARQSNHQDIEKQEFLKWLDTARPDDFVK